MKQTIFIVLTFTSSLALAAIPETTTIKCSDALSIIRRNGVINMTTNGEPYVRYVVDNSWCSSSEEARIKWTETLDAENCPLLTCVDKDEF